MKRVSRHLGLLLVVLSILQGATTAPVFAQTGDLISKGTTFNYAQVTNWIDVNRFVVTRWDGTISIFRPPNPSAFEFGPVLTQVVKLPSGQAAEMAAAISPQAFVTSNTFSSLAVWVANNSQYTLTATPEYDSAYGTANSAALVQAAGKHWLVTGHSEGYIVIWEVSGSQLTFSRAVFMRSPNPIPSPFQLWNVRSIVVWKNGIVATGAEDGDICLVNVVNGNIFTRMRYNPSAQRGINSLSIYGDYLALANCSVGPADKNIWLYKLSNGHNITLIDSENLIQNTSLPQVFNFSVQLAPKDGNIYYFASTQEGLLWMGHIVNDTLVTLNSRSVSCEAGATIAFQANPWLLAVTTFHINLFTVPSNP
jgi:WD40 repeat protein